MPVPPTARRRRPLPALAPALRRLALLYALSIALRPVEERRLAFSLAPAPASLAALRDRLGAWLEQVGAEPEEIHALKLASDEACANAIAHSGTVSEIEVCATVVGREVEIAVHDSGRWCDPPQVDAPEEGGRGLLLIEALSDRANVATGPEGTTVRIWRVLAGARRGGRYARFRAETSRL